MFELPVSMNLTPEGLEGDGGAHTLGDPHWTHGASPITLVLDRDAAKDTGLKLPLARQSLPLWARMQWVYLHLKKDEQAKLA